jgi:hypothetical protein
MTPFGSSPLPNHKVDFMRLSPLSSQNTYCSAKASPTHSQARTGVELNPPLPPVPFNTGEVDASFYRYLYGQYGTGIVGESHASPRRPFPPAQFSSEMDEAMKLLCQNGPITITADRINHGHTFIIDPRTNDPEYAYSIHARDLELPEVSTDGSVLDKQSNARVNLKGEAFPCPGKPLYKFSQNGKPEQLTLVSRSYPNALKLPVLHLDQALQDHNNAIIKFKIDNKLLNLNLAKYQSIIPDHIKEALNIISELLRPFNPELSYTKASHFS